MLNSVLDRFSNRTYRLIAVAMTAANLALILVAAWLGAASDKVFVSLSFYIAAAQRPILLFTYAVFAVLGGLLVARLPRLVYGWLWVWFAFSFVIIEFGRWYTAFRLFVLHETEPVMDFLAWSSTPAQLTALALLSYLLLLFPTGKLPSPRWKPLAWAVAVLFVVALAGRAFLPGFMDVIFYANPYGWMPFRLIPTTARLGDLAAGGLYAAVPLSVVSVLLRFRSTTHGSPERQQLKWFLFAALLVGAYFAATPLLGAFRVRQYWRDILSALAVTALAIAVTVAVLRFRLYDIDLIIRRTLVYAIVTALLASVYLGAVILLQSMLLQFSGQTSTIAIVVSTLAIAALFNPLRQRVQEILDQRFFRSKYDAQLVLQGFSSVVRDETDLDKLTSELSEVVRETMQPASVQVWLRTRDEHDHNQQL